MAELSAQGPILLHGATSVVDTTAGNKLGVRATDVDGNEYVYVDFQEACLPGEWVVFDSAYAASQLVATSRGWVGVVIGTVSASDRFGWVQVRGVHTGALVSSGSSVGPVVAHTTAIGSLATAPAGTGGVGVFGVALITAPDTCASTAIAATDAGVSTVYLNYPFITGAGVAASS